MSFKNYIPALFFSLLTLSLNAQSITQTIRGTVVDQSLQTPIPGATIVLLNSTPLRGTTTGPDGTFRLSQVPVGRQSLKISYVGYKDRIISNIVVDAGKELVVTVDLEESVQQVDEVVVRPQIEKDKPLNEMAAVSARTFSVEETQKFAAAINDPARMATAYAGVVGADDGGNQITIRGNSPNGLLWRMEGVEIPNPNHFSSLGAAGGGISILSAQLLTNSDFMTGAFPAEYGNALSGVFDLRLRKGNNAKREHTVQVGLLGIDVASEGPFSKNYRGSYLFNYRYSTLGILSKLGVSIGPAVNIFQDLSFNLYLPTNKLGNFTVFGFGGLSNSYINAPKDSTKWQSEYDRYNENFQANTGAAGITHSINLGRKAFLKTVLLASGFQNDYRNEWLTEDYTASARWREGYTIQKRIASSTLTYKFNARHTVRAGIIGAELIYDLSRKRWDTETEQMKTQIQARNATQTLQTYAQWNYRMTEQLTFNAGLHYLRLMLNNSDALEPRGSLKWAFAPNKAISFGYGLHSQMQNIGSYFVTTGSGSEAIQPNRNMGFTRSHHLVLGYDWSINDHLRVKAETYYQSLFNIPISGTKKDAFALVNSFDGLTTDRLINKGVGQNYGLELTVEQFLHNNFYFLWSSSLYESKYKGSDNIWRDTRFNGNYASSFLAGKEIVTGETGLFRKSVIGLNVKVSYYGGYRYTPIDLVASQQKGEAVFIDNAAYSQQLPDYFRTDIRLSWKKNRLNYTRTLSLDIQNVTNRQNVFGQYFDPRSGQVRTSYATPLIPVLSYRVSF
ncbi:carboxypeptidase-like regulatory domain-containing protein [Nibrella saemangeumensis]|uniref:Carboxypeptidase-like regulatory domain-containing protein n=1 Tax=Nibrella saemangeumensis TaxID=1084526 RepID=A0ABP8MTY3_9BACT